jgi:RNA polymerase sigma-70 factor (ECF subfamily)
MDTQTSPIGDSSPGIIASAQDLRTGEALRRGDEAAFTMLVNEHQAALLRLALMYVSDPAVAEDVVQETWIAVLQGIHRFEGRSSLKTWLFRILTNRAKTRAQREGRYVSLSALEELDAEAGQPSVSPERFFHADDPSAHHFTSIPQRFDEIPEDRLLSQETRAVIQRTIEMLPPNQRQVITLRDIEGWGSEEVCNVLEISETNQRVLLHRARSKVRQALENYLVG